MTNLSKKEFIAKYKGLEVFGFAEDKFYEVTTDGLKELSTKEGDTALITPWGIASGMEEFTVRARRTGYGFGQILWTIE